MNEKAEALFKDIIDLMYLRWGGGERKPCPIHTTTARILWDLWQLYEKGAPFKEVEDVVHIFCTLYGVPVGLVHAFVFGEASIYGALEIPA